MTINGRNKAINGRNRSTIISYYEIKIIMFW